MGEIIQKEDKLRQFFYKLTDYRDLKISTRVRNVNSYYASSSQGFLAIFKAECVCSKCQYFPTHLEEDLEIFSKSGAVVIPDSFGVAEALQEGRGLQNLLRDQVG